jgi:microcystin-dependent protein
MPLEAATYLDDLDITNPAATDGITDGDNHIRLIKQVLKNTFPNISAAMTAREYELNTGFIPIGGVIEYTGSVVSIPAGWVLCAGQTGLTRSDGGGTINAPDLRDKFVVGAGSTYAIGATGGATTHDHGAATGSTALTESQIPGHVHTGTTNNSTNTPTYNRFNTSVANRREGDSTTHDYQVGNSSFSEAIGSYTHSHAFTTASTGGGAGHTHPITSASSLPPYYALAKIMRI